MYYREDATGFWQVYRISSTGGSQVFLTNDSYDHYVPQWSPDGNWLVYEKVDATGYHQIYKTLSGIGIEENEMANKHTGSISIYPNPFVTMTSIRYSGIYQGDEICLGVYDLSGRHVRTLTAGNSSFGADLSPGVYFLSVVDAGGVVSEGRELMKVVKLE